MTALRAFILAASATLFLLLAGPPMFRNLPTLSASGRDVPPAQVLKWMTSPPRIITSRDARAA